MYCNNCGFRNPEDAVFCASCGSRIAENKAPAAPAPVQQHNAEFEGYTAHVSEPAPVSPYTAPGANAAGKAAVKPGDPSKNWAGITGFIMGILSLMLTPLLNFLGLPGLIFSIIGTKSQQKGMAVAGIILSILGLLLGLMVIIIVLMVVAASASEFSGFNVYEFEEYLDQFSGLAAYISNFIR